MNREIYWEQWKKWGLWAPVWNLELSHQGWVGLQSGRLRSPAYPVCLTTHLATGRAQQIRLAFQSLLYCLSLEDSMVLRPLVLLALVVNGEELVGGEPEFLPLCSTEEWRTDPRQIIYHGGRGR